MKNVYIFILFILLVSFIGAEDTGTLSLGVTPGVSIPLFDSTEIYTIGGGGGIFGKYTLPFAPFAHARVGIDYLLEPTFFQETVNMISLGGGAGLNFSPLPVLGIDVYLLGGYYLGMYKSDTGGNPLAKVGCEVSYFFDPSFSLGLGSAYNLYFSGTESFYQGANAYIGVAYHFGKAERRPQIKLENIEIYPIFPVFCKYYDENALGNIILSNKEDGAIKDVRVSFFVKQYMDSPKVCIEIKEMGRDEQRNVPLHALFADNIMTITEATKAQAEINVEYTYLDKQLSVQKVESMYIYDRNAMIWDDDRKAAAFVTAKNPAILRFSKNIAGIIRESGTSAVNLNFRLGMGVLEALKLYGINYAADPKTPYAEFSESDAMLDFLQFPVQTIEYKAGDCDDLSILYCALLESIGIETGFITVPGHIFMAFSLDIDAAKAKDLFLKPDDLIYLDGQTWLPVEITMVQQGFLAAWQAGAKEWREKQKAGVADFYNIHDAWQLYMPVGITTDVAGISMPDTDKFEAAYNRALQNFIEREIYPRVEKLAREIRQSNNDAKLINRLGVLYAKYGLIDEAKAEFEKISFGQKTYAPALINLGNICFLKKDFNQALRHYSKAYEKRPGSPLLLLGMAKTNYELAQYGSAQDAYQKLKKVSPTLAAKYAYLISGEDGTLRASSSALKEEVEWDEE